MAKVKTTVTLMLEWDTETGPPEGLEWISTVHLQQFHKGAEILGFKMENASPSDITLYTINLPSDTNITDEMLSTVQQTPSPELIQATHFFAKPRYWYLPTYPQGKKCSVARGVERM